MMKTSLLFFVFTVALCLNNGFSQPDCSSFSDWNGSTTYHSNNQVHFNGKIYRNRYDWNSSGQSPTSCICCSQWCMGGHQWYDEGGCTPTTLPVEMVHFKASKSGGSVLLTWETLVEINNDYFLLYKSVDGENWQELSKIAGSGNSSLPKKYSWIDTWGCNGICYYRLVQVDYDGSTETFDDIVFNSENESECGFCIKISPNPSEDQSTIGFTLPYSGDVNIFVFNEWGQQVLLISEPGVKGQNNIALNFSALAQGIYILRLLDSWGNSQVVRLVKN